MINPNSYFTRPFNDFLNRTERNHCSWAHGVTGRANSNTCKFKQVPEPLTSNFSLREVARSPDSGGGGGSRTETSSRLDRVARPDFVTPSKLRERRRRASRFRRRFRAPGRAREEDDGGERGNEDGFGRRRQDLEEAMASFFFLHLELLLSLSRGTRYEIPREEGERNKRRNRAKQREKSWFWWCCVCGRKQANHFSFSLFIYFCNFPVENSKLEKI